METIAQNWERLLFYSGGALNLKKMLMEHATMGVETRSPNLVQKAGRRRQHLDNH
jgi:hypothetical protein